MVKKVLTIVERSASEEFSVAKIPHGLSMLLLRVLYKCSVRLSASVLMPLYSFHSEITLLKFTWLKTSFFSLILEVPICVLKLAFLFLQSKRTIQNWIVHRFDLLFPPYLCTRVHKILCVPGI